jgi:hypothetical protein
MKLTCPSSKDPARIIKDTHGSIDMREHSYYPCPGPADPDRAWLCQQCRCAAVETRVAA